jgi:hypothetical protein
VPVDNSSLPWTAECSDGLGLKSPFAMGPWNLISRKWLELDTKILGNRQAHTVIVPRPEAVSAELKRNPNAVGIIAEQLCN